MAKRKHPSLTPRQTPPPAQTPQESDVLHMDDMKQFILLAIDQHGEPVMRTSKNITLPDLSALLARAQSNIRLQETLAALHEHSTKANKPTSPLIHRGR